MPDTESQPQRPRRQRRPNAAEAEFLRACAGQCEPKRRGWPDFWWQVNGRLHVAEVKPRPESPLRLTQFDALCALSSNGIAVYTWNPEDGLVEFDPNAWVCCLATINGKPIREYYTRSCAVRWKRRIVERPVPFSRLAGPDTDSQVTVLIQSEAKIGPSRGGGPSHAKPKLRTLVQMARFRYGQLRRGTADRLFASLEMKAIIWALEELGYPPSRYNELMGEKPTRGGSFLESP